MVEPELPLDGKGLPRTEPDRLFHLRTQVFARALHENGERVIVLDPEALGAHIHANGIRFTQVVVHSDLHRAWASSRAGIGTRSPGLGKGGEHGMDIPSPETHHGPH